MASGILGIGAMGLNAAQAGIRATQNNISNVNTAGYHRQGTNFVSALPLGSIGNGVNVAGVNRAYDRFLENELILSQGQLSRHEIYAGYATQMDAMLGNEASGLSTAFNNFFAAVNEVANAPTSTAARQTMLTSGTNLVRRLDDLDSLARNMQDSINQQIRDSANQVSSYAARIAEINTKVTLVRSTSGDTAANELMDQRDQLAAEINKLVGATVVVQGDGSYNLYIGSGQALVTGGYANSLVAIVDPADPTQLTPALRIGTSDIPLGATQLTGGKLGGLLAFREDMLIPTQRELGTIAYALASEFNSQHTVGLDLNGGPAGNFFTAPTLRDPVAYQNNTGNAVYGIAVTDPNLLANSDYRLSYTGGNYTLTRLSDNTSFTAATLGALNTAISGEGLSFSLTSGAIAAGDTYLVRPTQYSAHGLSLAIGDPSDIAAALTAAPGDNQNALLLAGLQTQKLLGNTTNTLQSAYSQLVSRNATLANGADINVQAYETLTEQATAAQQSFSGVNLDEEAANLIQYQQAYQAAARAMQIAASLFEEILSIAR